MKPGQLCTINNKVCRITKGENPKFACENCKIKRTTPDCCFVICDRLEVPYNCYPKIIKQ